MRLRCFLWPYNLPHDLICKCSKPLSFNHLLTVTILLRTVQFYMMLYGTKFTLFQSHTNRTFVEPLLRKLSIKDEDDSCGQRRADVIVPSSSDKLYVVDVVTVDGCKLSVVKNSLSEVSPLFDAESIKFSKNIKLL
ncbi:hypothetical protein RCL1_001538 [Eukaryota sp. TZLM3-RCL]